MATKNTENREDELYGIFYWGPYIALGVTILCSFFYGIPVQLQMVIYTASIIYIGSHLSLLQKQINPVTGEHEVKMETLCQRDALFFPVIGSCALFGLYLAYKFLSSYWINFIMAAYLTIFGSAALGETFTNTIGSILPWSSKKIYIPCFFSRLLCEQRGNPDIFYVSVEKVLSYSLSAVIVVIWAVTDSWVLHNLLAISFCIQGIRLVSVGSFKIAFILLIGLFLYDIFWVFATDVMVSVAKSFKGPAKLIFPISHEPWQQSILGLGDIIVPGIFIAMILRFDHNIYLTPKRNLDDGHTKNLHNNIAQNFSKFHFFSNLAAYEFGLMLTCFFMLMFRRAQPALLYLVPCCLLVFLVTTAIKGHFYDALSYTELPPEEALGVEENESTGKETALRNDKKLSPEDCIVKSKSDLRQRIS